MNKRISGNTALKIDYFDSIGIEITVPVEHLRSGLTPKNEVLNTFERIDDLPFVGLNIKFSKNNWDFNANNDLPVARSTQTFNFIEHSSYTRVLKMYVLNDLLKKKTKIRVLKNKFLAIKKALSFFENEGYTSFENIPRPLFLKYIKQLEESCSYNSISAYCGHLLMFIEFYERTFTELYDQSIKKLLKNRNTALLNDIKRANKTPEIPIDFFPPFLDAIKSIMRNPDEDPEDRITAASIILYSQIGFRTAELFTVKTNSIKEVYSPNKNSRLFYLEFLSFKHGKGDTGSTIAQTYINNLSLEAYQILDELCKPARTRLGIDTLFVTKFQKYTTFNTPTYAERYRKFMLRHWKELDNVNIGDIFDDLSSFEVSYYFQPDSKGEYTYDINADWVQGLKMTDRIYYPTIRQFRVSVCTSLYRQQIPLHYIRKHMNHLSEDMTAYYIRSDKKLEKQYSEAIYRAIFKDGSKLLGQNSDAFVQKINEFIQENNLNIQDNTDSVLNTLSSKFPLRSKIGGMCIRCGDVIPCASSSSTDVIYCAFGMCPNHCHMFFMADYAYEEYLQHKDIVQWNLEHNFKKAHQKELHKLQYHIENTLLPELVSLEGEIDKHGEEYILEKYPQLTYIINNLTDIKQEVLTWTSSK